MSGWASRLSKETIRWRSTRKSFRSSLMPEPVSVRIRAKDRDAILQSLAAGVVPRRGQQHIQVGRSAEVSALLRDIERIADGGSAVRFIIGEYGAGKTFFLQLVRSIALEKNLVTI